MIVIRDKDFYINGKAEKLYCGAIHYFRVFKEQWHDRLYKLKCLGFNTVETYCPWNLHEKKEGVFNFSGMLDLVHFIEIATELGLYIIIRPGPYICSECDFGGLPSWLLKNESVAVRSDNAFYLARWSGPGPPFGGWRGRSDRRLRRRHRIRAPIRGDRGGNAGRTWWHLHWCCNEELGMRNEK